MHHRVGEPAKRFQRPSHTFRVVARRSRRVPDGRRLVVNGRPHHSRPRTVGRDRVGRDAGGSCRPPFVSRPSGRTKT